jgi:O-antigen/teichoic acid export membrane protein
VTVSQVLRRNLSSMLTVAVAVAVINFLSNVLLARELGPEALGRFVLHYSAAHLVFAIAAPGFDQAYIHQPEARGRWASVVLLTAMQTILCLIGGGGLALVARWLFPVALNAFDVSAFSLVLLAACLAAWFNLGAAILAVEMKYQQISVVRLVATAVAAGLSTLAAVGGFSDGVWPFVWRELLIGSVSCVAILILARIPRWSPASVLDLREALRFSRGLWALNLLEKCAQRLEYLLLGGVLQVGVMGSYSAVRGLCESVYGIVSYPLQTVVFSLLCKSGTAGVVRRIRSVMKHAWMLTLVLAMVGLVGLLFVPVLRLLFGEKFQFSAVMIVAFAVSVANMLGFEFLKVVMMAEGCHQRLVLGRSIHLLALVVAIPLSAALWGADGAAIALAVSSGALCAVAFMISRPALKI